MLNNSRLDIRKKENNNTSNKGIRMCNSNRMGSMT